MPIVLHTALSVSSYKTPRKEQKSEFWAPRAPNSLFFCAVKRLRFYEDSQAQLFFPWALLSSSYAFLSGLEPCCELAQSTRHTCAPAPSFFDRVAYVLAIPGSSSTRKLKELQGTP